MRIRAGGGLRRVGRGIWIVSADVFPYIAFFCGRSREGVGEVSEVLGVAEAGMPMDCRYLCEGLGPELLTVGVVTGIAQTTIEADQEDDDDE